MSDTQQVHRRRASPVHRRRASPVHRRRAFAGGIVVAVALAALVNSLVVTGSFGAMRPNHQFRHHRATTTTRPTTSSHPTTTTSPKTTTTIGATPPNHQIGRAH